MSDYYICLIEDEALFAQSLRTSLKKEGYTVDLFLDGRTGRRAIKREAYDLIILDVNLPDDNGFNILGDLRGEGSQIPVLMLTAQDSSAQKVSGLDLGANDYLTKPFDQAELLARIRRVLRERVVSGQELSCGDLHVDVHRRRVVRSGVLIDMPNQEYKLLQYLLEHTNQVVSRAMLSQDVWEIESRLTSLNNVIDVTVSLLRERIDKPFEPKLLLTIRGVGYMLKDPHEA